MEILTVVADLEETFGLRIPEKELRNFVTMGDLVDALADGALAEAVAAGDEKGRHQRFAVDKDQKGSQRQAVRQPLQPA